MDSECDLIREAGILLRKLEKLYEALGNDERRSEVGRALDLLDR